MGTNYKYEYKVKSLLEQFFPERNKNLIKSECPDFHNDVVGLEITTATSKNDMEINAFFSEYANKDKKDIPFKLLRKIEKNTHLIYSDGRLSGYRDSFKYSYSIIKKIKKILINKTKKLNNNYNIYKNNNLAIQIRENFIFNEDYDNDFEKEIMNEFLNLLKETIVEINENYKIAFDFIYVVYENVLISINEKKSYKSWIVIKK